MKIEIGSETKNIEIRTPQQFANAMRNPMLSAQVFTMTDANHHNELLKLLNRTARTICLLHVGGEVIPTHEEPTNLNTKTTNTKSVMLTFRGTPTLKNLLNRVSKQENVNRSDLIRETLERALPIPTR